MESIQKKDTLCPSLHLQAMYCLQEFTRVYKFWKIWGVCGTFGLLCDRLLLL